LLRCLLHVLTMRPTSAVGVEDLSVCLVFSASPHLDPLTRAVTLDLEHALMMMM